MAYPVNLNKTELEFLLKIISEVKCYPHTKQEMAEKLMQKLKAAKLLAQWSTHRDTLQCLPLEMLTTMHDAMGIHLGMFNGGGNEQQYAINEMLVDAIEIKGKKK